ncbi:hypothetical protein EDC01DRAFT_761489 [Geopyxis carbonaria]|nr:hypothetical protein EDC01DRAFT_761489 [Geopyxis carbonaria]
MNSPEQSDVEEQPTINIGQKIFMLEKDALNHIKALHKSAKVTLDQHQLVLEQIIALLTPYTNEPSEEVFKSPRAVYIPEHLDGKLEPALAFCTPLRLGKIIADKSSLKKSALKDTQSTVNALNKVVSPTNQNQTSKPIEAETVGSDRKIRKKIILSSVTPKDRNTFFNARKRDDAPSFPNKSSAKNDQGPNINCKTPKIPSSRKPTMAITNTVMSTPAPAAKKIKLYARAPNLKNSSVDNDKILATAVPTAKRQIKLATGSRKVSNGSAEVNKNLGTAKQQTSLKIKLATGAPKGIEGSVEDHNTLATATTGPASIAVRRADEALHQAKRKRPATSPTSTDNKPRGIDWDYYNAKWEEGKNKRRKVEEKPEI